ncbi:hypothetical protein D3C85_978180 [compost metagenome]
MRSMVLASNRSVAYVNEAPMPFSCSNVSRDRSNLAVFVLHSKPDISRPGKRCWLPLSSVWWLYSTWNNGLWPRLRSGCKASTSCSNGRSWWACAPRTHCLTCCSSSLNVSCTSNSARSTWVLTKKPIRRSVSTRLRLAVGTPTRMSAWPE